ncbi:putative Protein kinase domain-containing protein [Seiridium unicorne]|uniref:Protein kinase domain-containing protein n=1 Tax=Seiridium unicorne TaxID=138068 RepID=A0ABR2UQX2_9PEZI
MDEVSSYQSRVRSSRIASTEPSEAPEHSNITASTELWRDLAGLKEIIAVLRASNIPEPAVVTGPDKYIGQGSQFIVQEGSMMIPAVSNFTYHRVAIKRPKFALDPNKPFSIIDGSAQSHLKNLATEVKALTAPELRNHLNVVRLLAWSTLEGDTSYSPPLLVMELASSDMHSFLKQEAGEPSLKQKYFLCNDIASGLDAIHKCGFVHGDLKPANILMFSLQDRALAKLADFGLSFGDSDKTATSFRLGGTSGWQAPEVEAGQPLNLLEASKADNYSFGIVIWSIYLACGDPPKGLNATDRKDWAIEELERANTSQTTDPTVFRVLDDVIPALLCQDAAARPTNLVELLIRQGKQFMHPDPLIVNEPQEIVGVSSEQHVPESRTGLQQMESFPWEVSSRLNPLVRSLIPRFMENDNNANGSVIFNVFLDFTTMELRPETRNTSGYSPWDVVMAAARRGHLPAKAVIPDVLHFYQDGVPDQLRTQLLGYLSRAVGTGSTFARKHLERRDPEALCAAYQRFEADGGYGGFYHSRPPEHRLHRITALGSLSDLTGYLESMSNTDLDHRTPQGETALYLACSRGSWGIVDKLLSSGAKITEKCTKFGITCAHWLFAFDTTLQDTVIGRLIQKGADINAKVTEPFPLFHYPFQVPAGTPLHWAVTTHVHTTIRALVEHGADITIRDGCDPYKFDERVRVLGTYDSLYDEVTSFSETSTQGLSALDYAAMDHDPFLFELLVSSQRDVEINATDEEGFSVLHRLGTSPLRRTRSGCSFSFLPFQGNPTDLEDQLRRTVRAIVSLGGDLNQLTTPNIHLAQEEQNKGMTIEWNSYTPLMLAALGGRSTVVKVLLEAGADANKENEGGITALHYFCENQGPAREIARLLISAGAKVTHSSKTGVTPLQRAADAHNVDVMDRMLSHGANIEDTVKNPRSQLEGSSVIACLVRRGYVGNVFDETYDISVSASIERWLTVYADHDQRRRVLTRCAPNSGTLLYTFAGAFMRHSVAALIRLGAGVNSVSTQWHLEWLGDRRMKIISQETPLDAVIRYKGLNDDIMNKHRRKTIPENNHICMRAESVIKALLEAGGTRAPKSETAEPTLPDSKAGEVKELI